MEVQDEAQKENQVFGGMAKFVANGVNVLRADDAEDSGGQTMQLEDNRAVVIMNAHCIVQMANKSAYTMFGYTKVSDLIGKNVNVLIPVSALTDTTSIITAVPSCHKPELNTRLI